MIKPIIMACCNSSTERFLLTNPKMGSALLKYVQGEVESATGCRKIQALACPQYVASFKSLDISTQYIDALSYTTKTPFQAFAQLRDISLQPLEKHQWIFLLAPGAGPITRNRITSLLHAISTGTETDILVSAHRMPANCNPAWLSTISVDDVVGDHAPLDDFHRDLSLKTDIGLGRTSKSPSATKPLGSQWLPNLYHFDGAVAAIKTSSCITGNTSDNWTFIAAPDNDSTPLLYNLPFFNLDTNIPINWNISEDKIESLFALSRPCRPEVTKSTHISREVCSI